MSIIRIDRLESENAQLALQFQRGAPFAHVVIDNFADTVRALELWRQLPDPEREGLRKSRDYIFAKNKFEKAGLTEISPLFAHSTWRSWLPLCRAHVTPRFSRRRFQRV